MKLVRKIYSSVETKATEDKERSLIVRISTSTPDRSNDIVHPQGIILDNYLRNPVVAFGHKYNELAIAKAQDIQVHDSDITAKVVFPDEGVDDFADKVYYYYKNGFMNAWSIGFVPKKIMERGESWRDGREYLEWELLEFSAVLVPDNPEALTIMRGKGIDTEPLEKAMEGFEEEVEIVDRKEEKSDEPKTEENEEDEAEETTQKFISMDVDFEGKSITLTLENNEKFTADATDELIDELQTQKSAIEELAQLKKTQEETLESQEETIKVVPLSAEVIHAFRSIDQIAGKALRDLKRTNESSVNNDEETRFVPIVSRAEGSEK